MHVHVLLFGDQIWLTFSTGWHIRRRDRRRPSDALLGIRFGEIAFDVNACIGSRYLRYSLCIFLLDWGVMDCESVLGIVYTRVSPFVWAGFFYFFFSVSLFMRKRNERPVHSANYIIEVKGLADSSNIGSLGAATQFAGCLSSQTRELGHCYCVSYMCCQR